MRSLLLLTTLLAFALACTATPEPMMGVDPEADLPDGDVGEFDDSKADLGSIEWRRPETPTTFVMGEAHPEQIDYSQCYSVEPEEGVDIAIVCDPAWSEVAWYRVDPADVEAALAEGLSTFSLRVESQVPEEQVLLRATVRSVDDAGETERIAAHPQLFSGDTLTATLEATTELYIYIGKGRTIGPWDNGTISFVVTPSFAE